MFAKNVNIVVFLFFVLIQFKSNMLKFLEILALLSLYAVVDTSGTNSCPGLTVPQVRWHASSHELSMVFYYTSWHQSSMRAKIIFDELAVEYADFLHTASVDCWHMQCNCSQTVDVVIGSGAPHHYPTLIVRYGRSVQIQYTGEWTSGALQRFIYHLLTPVQRINTGQQLKDLHSKSDAVVLGCFRSTGSDYAIFVATALRWLEVDPEKSFRFVVALGEVTASKLQPLPKNSSLPQIVAFVDKTEPAIFPMRHKWNSSELLQWTQAELKRSLGKVHGYSTPTRLINRIKHRPTLVIYGNGTRLYDEMQSIIKLDKTKTYCKSQTDISFQPMVLGNNINRHNCRDVRQLINANTIRNYFFYNHALNEKLKSHSVASQHQQEMQQILRVHERQWCLSVRNQPKPEQQLYLAKFLQRSLHKLRLQTLMPDGQAANQSVAVVILDALRFPDFPDKVGIPFAGNSAAAAFIVNAADESTYLMPQPFSLKDLYAFTKDYYQKSLNSFHIASETAAVHQQNEVYLTSFNRLQILQSISSLQQPSYHNRTLIVMLYSPQCALCSMLSNILLKVQLLVGHSSSDIEFLRVNTQSNELPWEFRIHSTPTLMVFPHSCYSESRIYPSHLELNVRNVFGFILAQLNPVDQVRMSVRSCATMKKSETIKSCLNFSKALVVQHIGQHLKLWQIYTAERNSILEKLRHFRDFSWSIQQAFKT